MRDEYKRSRNPDVGVAAYLISKPWLEKYKKYIHYDALKSRRDPAQTEDHCKTNYPGKITNEDFLDFDENVYLTGTNTNKNFEASWIDRYIKERATEGMSYEIIP
jgi:hypothetical protein